MYRDDVMSDPITEEPLFTKDGTDHFSHISERGCYRGISVTALYTLGGFLFEEWLLNDLTTFLYHVQESVLKVHQDNVSPHLAVQIDS